MLGQGTAFLSLVIVFGAAGCNRDERKNLAPSLSPAPSLASPAATATPSPTPSPDRTIGHGWKLRSREFSAVSHKYRYKIEGDYPEISPSTDLRTRRINSEIKRRIAKQYRWAIVRNSQNLRDQIRLGRNEDPLNTAEFDYELLFENGDLLSIRFHDMNYSYPAAHSGEDYFSLSFDLRNGKAVPFAAMFQATAKFRRQL